jgi:hypothetical protein
VVSHCVVVDDDHHPLQSNALGESEREVNANPKNYAGHEREGWDNEMTAENRRRIGVQVQLLTTITVCRCAEHHNILTLYYYNEVCPSIPP